MRVSFTAIFISSAASGVNFYSTHQEVVPLPGGEYIEAVVGSPKYINPLFASVSDADQDLSRLVYSSLYHRGPNGKLISDLALDHEVSEDEKTYFFNIRQDVSWHDGGQLTADDIVFTFNALKDRQYKSPLRASFGGVEIEKIEDYRFKFVLSDPYAAFLNLLTFGIIPERLWQQIPPDSANLAELNLKPIGSGPYKFDKLAKDRSGVIREYYLIANGDYYERAPYVDIGFKFYNSFEEALAALNDKQVNGISYLPSAYKKNLLMPNALNYHRLQLPQLTALFFNRERLPALTDKNIRQSLALAIDQKEIISAVLEGEAYEIDGPILPNSFAYDPEIKKYGFDAPAAAALLEEAGWVTQAITAEAVAAAQKLIETGEEDTAAESLSEAGEIMRLGEGSWRQKDGQYLFIVLTTVDRSENIAVAEAIKVYWEKVGVRTEVASVPPGKVQAEVLKPRNFQVFFYGQIVGADPDPYAFWHSSQFGEAGLNIANFTNKEVDQLLEDARLIAAEDERREKYRRFQEIIADELPAVFLYSPAYTYVQSKELKGFAVSDLYIPSDRFANIGDWYLKTGKKIIWR